MTFKGNLGESCLAEYASGCVIVFNMAKDKRIGLRMELIDRQRLEAASYALGLSIAEVVRAVIAGCVESGTESPTLCGVCQRPRRDEPINDVMAHAQCDQITRELERQIPA